MLLKLIKICLISLLLLFLLDFGIFIAFHPTSQGMLQSVVKEYREHALFLLSEWGE